MQCISVCVSQLAESLQDCRFCRTEKIAHLDFSLASSCQVSISFPFSHFTGCEGRTRFEITVILLILLQSTVIPLTFFLKLRWFSWFNYRIPSKIHQNFRYHHLNYCQILSTMKSYAPLVGVICKVFLLGLSAK